jgi:hypothetical protein
MWFCPMRLPCDEPHFVENYNTSIFLIRSLPPDKPQSKKLYSKNQMHVMLLILMPCTYRAHARVHVIKKAKMATRAGTSAGAIAATYFSQEGDLATILNQADVAQAAQELADLKSSIYGRSASNPFPPTTRPGLSLLFFLEGIRMVPDLSEYADAS